MMNTLLFKIGSLVFLGSSTVAALLYSGLCPDGKRCQNTAECPWGKVAAASTVQQTAEPAAIADHCAKQKAAAYAHCDKQKAAAMASCPKSAAKKAHAGCKYAKSDTQVAQAAEKAQPATTDN